MEDHDPPPPRPPEAPEGNFDPLNISKEDRDFAALMHLIGGVAVFVLPFFAG